MVNGLDVFRRYFEDFTDDYIVIGGVACDLALNFFGRNFRLTRDFDIIIVSENLKTGFGNRLKEFIRDGGYIIQSRKSTDKPSFFRFVNPQNGDFPFQLELASNKPADDWTSNFVPLNVGDAKSSLSAIIFESAYYDFIRSNAILIDGISTIRIEGLIPLKALAFLKLSEIESPTEKKLIDINKHVNDILLIADILPEGIFNLPSSVAADLSNAIATISKRELTVYQQDMLNIIKRFYGLV